MSRKITIQVYSDIHLDLIKSNRNVPLQINIKPISKYLFLAGNICKLNHELFFKFFDYCSTHWVKIFFTPGNKDFYSSKKNYSLLDFEYELKIREKYKNIFYLNRGVASLNDEIDVYGCVFWTTPSPELSQWYISDNNNIQQFSLPKKINVPIDNKFVKELSVKDFEHLNTFLNSNKKKAIVMTHFPPLQKGTSNPNLGNQFKELKDYNAWDDSICSLNLTDVVVWISGHTHWSYDIKHDNIRLISNQIGYLNEQGLTKSSLSGLFEIDY
jgi:predicted phosphodiesterase